MIVFIFDLHRGSPGTDPGFYPENGTGAVSFLTQFSISIVEPETKASVSACGT
jgi:hypothetical protein